MNNRSMTRWTGRILGVCLIATLAGSAIAQGSKSSKSKPGASAPAVLPPPVLTRHAINKRDWTLHCEIRLHGFQYRARESQDIAPTTRMRFNRALFYFPVAPGSSMHDWNKGKTKGYVRAENVDKDDTPRFADGYQCGTQLMVFDVGEVDTVRLTMHTETAMTSYETVIDEARAREITWPKEPWEPLIASALQPQLFIEVEDEKVQQLVKEWTNGNPRGAKPYDLAKHLAVKVFEYYAPT